MRVGKRQPGFVLVMVLVLLALAAAVMAKAVRRSNQAMLASAQAQQELRWRWASVSLERFAAAHATEMLQAQNRQDRPWQLRMEVAMNDQKVELLLADEQAKANVNALWGRFDPPVVEESLRKLLDSQGLFAAIRPNPATGGTGGGAFQSFQTFQTYEQVFPNVGYSDLAGEEDRAALADAVTLWGSGALNIRTASLPVLRCAMAGLMTEEQIGKLDALRRERPALSVSEFLKSIQATREQGEKLLSLLTDRSDCYSLFLSCQDGQSRQQRLYVWDNTNPGIASLGKLKVFQW